MLKKMMKDTEIYLKHYFFVKTMPVIIMRLK